MNAWRTNPQDVCGEARSASVIILTACRQRHSLENFFWDMKTHKKDYDYFINLAFREKKIPPKIVRASLAYSQVRPWKDILFEQTALLKLLGCEYSRLSPLLAVSPGVSKTSLAARSEERRLQFAGHSCVGCRLWCNIMGDELLLNFGMNFSVYTTTWEISAIWLA